MTDGGGSESGDGGDDRGLLGRLRDWLGSLFGGGDGGGGGAAGRGADAAAAAGVCAVCGTPVDDPGTGCPLCGSTDVEPQGRGDPSGGEGLEGGDATPGPERRSVEGTTDDAVTRLRDVQGEAGAEGAARERPVDDADGDGGGESTPDDDGERGTGAGE